MIGLIIAIVIAAGLSITRVACARRAARLRRLKEHRRRRNDRKGLV